MDREPYQELTRALAHRLAEDERVLGLVALGSMAEQDYRPDEWSDHDFFVVTTTGEQERFRSELGWLPAQEEVAFSFRETAHGLKVLYRDGHLLEFAVFDLEELGLARVNRWRVLFDRGGVGLRLTEIAEATARSSADAVRDDRWLLGQLVTALLVGGGRARRGEVLAGTAVLGHATALFLQLAAKHVPSGLRGLLDDLDPHRRFERVYPELAEAISAAQRRDPVTFALELCRLAQSELQPRISGFPDAAFAAVERRLQG